MPVVVVEIQVVHSVASGTVHNGAIGNVLAIMNEDSPQIDETEQENISQFLKRKDERENMVRHTLRPSIKRVESVRSIRARHDPLMMRLVQSAVNARVVQASMNPVNEEIGETDEEWELQDTVIWERFFGDGIVEFSVSADFQDEEWSSQ